MNDVPKQTHLQPIGNRYYFRAWVPLVLVRKAAAEFDQRNGMLRAQANGTETPVTERQLEELAIEWLAERERRNIERFLVAEPLGDGELERIIDTISDDELRAREGLARGDFSDAGNLAQKWLE